MLADLEQINVEDPKMPAMVINGYDVHEEDINTMTPGELINDTILSVMLR
jgi:Ulp1 family protease